jgi:hypothetical protein
MSRALVLKLQPDGVLALVAIAGGEAITVESAVFAPLKPNDDAHHRGQAIAEAIAEIRPARSPVVVAVPRSELAWQTYDLPPAPAADLPDLVLLQAQRDLALSDDGAGFDFLPLFGDESQAHRVIVAGLPPQSWQALRAACDAADLRVDRAVPEALGWAELGRRALTASDHAGGLNVFSAIIQRQAAVWATEGETLRLLRTVWLPADDNQTADAAALGGELRRTLLALAQSHPELRAGVHCVYVGENADEIAGELGATLSRPVQAASLDRLVDVVAVNDATLSIEQLAPLAALGAAAAERRPAPLDLLHPRRPPAAPSRMRTQALMATAAGLLVALVAWRGYRNLQEPLEAAEAAKAARAALVPQLEALAADEAKAAAIRRWVDNSANLLTELDAVARQIRPDPLDSDAFKADQDLVLTKFAQTHRVLSLEASARTSDAIQPAEARLRAAEYRVDRGPVNSSATAVPGHSVSVEETLQRQADVAPAGAAP